MSSQRALRKMRGRIRGFITRAHTYMDAVTDNVTVEDLEVRLTTLEDNWKQLQELENALCEFEDEEAENDTFDTEHEAKYLKTHALLIKAIREKKGVYNNDIPQSSLDALASQQASLLQKLGDCLPRPCGVVLPKIVIPPFSGDYTQWTSFRDLFMGAIESKTNLTNTQKFYYLTSLLSGEAADLVKNIAIDDDNYLSAWEKLENRFDRPHLVARAYMKRFIDLPSLTSPNTKSLRKVIDGADESIRGLFSIGLTQRDPWLIFLLLSKVDSDTRRDWYDEVGTRIDSTLTEFLQFLENRFIRMESNDLHSKLIKINSIRVHVANTNSDPTTCIKCNKNHATGQCPELKVLSLNECRKFIEENSLCYNCLRSGHRASKCSSKYRCRVCTGRHHTLIHSSPQVDPNFTSANLSQLNNDTGAAHSFRGSSAAALGSVTKGNHNSFAQQPVVSQPLAIEPISGGSSNSANLISPDGQVIQTNQTSLIATEYCQTQAVLPTAVVLARDKLGNTISIRALLDSASQASFITESCFKCLGGLRENARIDVQGISATEVGCTRGHTKLTIYSRLNNSCFDIDAFILPRITANHPSQPISIDSFSKLNNLTLADPNFGYPGKIDLLIGVDVIWAVLKEEKLRIEKNLFAIDSVFGYLVSGQMMEVSKPLRILTHITSLDKLLQDFWKLDECDIVKPNSFVDDPAEIHFQNTHSRNLDGKYIVKLPFKENILPEFENTVNSAIVRLHAMERRFSKNSDFKNQYINFMHEYMSLGHMELVPIGELNKTPSYYLPHHAVLKSDSRTTKLRVVFDGSSKDSFGKSLNDSLLIGPAIQRDLFGVSLRFRKSSFVFTADIVKMFRQVWVSPEHQDYQRIVWRFNASDPIQHFRLKTVTYGTASAPFLSVRVLEQLAIDNLRKFPNAANVVLQNIYVDDVMAGTETEEELSKLKEELITLLESGGFHLRKWGSNSSKFLKELEGNEYVHNFVDKHLESNYMKLLGLYWSPQYDSYSFLISESLHRESHEKITKRIILSEIARIFDVFGFLAPCVVKLKILFQSLWLLDVSWDHPLPNDVICNWLNIRRSFTLFEKVSVPRKCMFFDAELELHCFSDASEAAYAAVIYCVSRSKNATEVNLLAAKTRVAPLKVVSIPRLELCGALLLCRLFESVSRSLGLKSVEVYAWTDSEIVLHWLSSPPREMKTFVGNRTQEILDTIPRGCWSHVKTDHNPADCASRGIDPKELINHTLWWQGPSWLRKPKSNWPKSKFSIPTTDPAVLHERKTEITVAVSGIEIPESILLTEANRFSSWNRLIRVLALVYRAIALFRRKIARTGCPLSFTEINASTTCLLLAVQKDSFPKTLLYLNSYKPLPKQDKLRKLFPFIDETGLLRVGGRIQNSTANFNIKHPIILPRSHVTEMIAQNLHENYLHVGAMELFVILRQQYWVLGARNLVRAIVFSCKRCFILKKAASTQLMGNLPRHRVQRSRPFLHSGCDFAGPLKIKMTNCRNPRVTKAYICLFVCMSSKAIHLELVGDLSSHSFIDAFKRFVSRRGKCSHLYTDNGTNFQGARRVLDDMRKLLMDKTANEDILAELAKDGTCWHFIAPSSPHFGGLWEAGVRSVKLHLRRVLSERLLSFEEMYTILTQIEAILNSRPLCAISDTDVDPLTPSHFLIGEPLTAIPTPNYLTTPLPRLTLWAQYHAMVQGFWKRWSNEYLTSLQKRPKWQQTTENFKVDDLVVIKEPNLPPTKWITGRIEVAHTGADGHVRVVTIKTSKGRYTRPVTKIARLPNC